MKVLKSVPKDLSFRIWLTSVVGREIINHFREEKSSNEFGEDKNRVITLDINPLDNGEMMGEISLSSYPNSPEEMYMNGDAWDDLRKDIGEKAARGYVVHPGDIRLPLGPGVIALPFAEL